MRPQLGSIVECEEVDGSWVFVRRGDSDTRVREIGVSYSYEYIELCHHTLRGNWRDRVEVSGQLIY
jgi:hypothetical protein